MKLRVNVGCAKNFNYSPPNLRIPHFGFTTRHDDKVSARLHYSTCQAIGNETTENWSAHTPRPVCEHEDVTVLHNQGGTYR